MLRYAGSGGPAHPRPVGSIPTHVPTLLAAGEVMVGILRRFLKFSARRDIHPSAEAWPWVGEGSRCTGGQTGQRAACWGGGGPPGQPRAGGWGWVGTEKMKGPRWGRLLGGTGWTIRGDAGRASCPQRHPTQATAMPREQQCVLGLQAQGQSSANVPSLLGSRAHGDRAWQDWRRIVGPVLSSEAWERVSVSRGPGKRVGDGHSGFALCGAESQGSQTGLSSDPGSVASCPVSRVGLAPASLPSENGDVVPLGLDEPSHLHWPLSPALSTPGGVAMLSAAGLGEVQQATLFILLLLTVGNGARRPSGSSSPSLWGPRPQTCTAVSLRPAGGAQRPHQASLCGLCLPGPQSSGSLSSIRVPAGLCCPELPQVPLASCVLTSLGTPGDCGPCDSQLGFRWQDQPLSTGSWLTVPRALAGSGLPSPPSFPPGSCGHSACPSGTRTAPWRRSSWNTASTQSCG